MILILCAIGGGVFYCVSSRNSQITGGKSTEGIKKSTSNVETKNVVNAVNTANTTNIVNKAVNISNLPNTKFLAGKVGNNTLIVKLSQGTRTENEIDTTSFYMNQGGSLNTKITTNNGNYIITELYNNNPIGVYTLKEENNQLVGSFKDVNDGSKSLSNVTFVFTNNIEDYYPTNDTIGFAEEVFQKKIIDENAPDLDKVVEKGKAEIWNISMEEFNSIQKLHFDNNEGAVMAKTPQNAIVLQSRNATSFMGKDTLLGKPTLLVNGIKVWAITVWPACTYVDCALDHAMVLIGANGFVYNNEDIFQAAENGNLIGTNSKGQYGKLTVDDVLQDSQTSGYVLQDNGSSTGLICSSDNPESKAFMNKFYQMREAYFAKIDAQYNNQ